MAKKKSSTAEQSKELSTKSDARKARKAEVTKEYGDILYSSEFELTPHLETEMAHLYGPENRRGMVDLIAGILCAVIVLMLIRSQDLLPVAVVLVIITVGVMALANKLDDLALRQLDKHGYNAALLSEGDNTYATYATRSHVVVIDPNNSLSAYSLEDLVRSRNDGNNCLVAFGKGRTALFTRKSMGGANFSELVEWLDEKEPPTVGETLRARFGKK